MIDGACIFALFVPVAVLAAGLLLRAMGIRL